MFARELVTLHNPPLLGRKPSSAKSRVSISSKLIEIKGLFNSLISVTYEKQGGGGVTNLLSVIHSFLRTRRSLARRSFSGGGVTPFFYLLYFPCIRAPASYVSCFPCLRKNRGVGGMSSQSSFLRSRLFRLFTKNVGAPTFLVFPIISRTFLALSAVRRVARSAALTQRRGNEKRAGMKASATFNKGGDLRRHRPLDSLSPRATSSPLSLTSLQYPAPIAPDLARTEPIRIPALCGEPAVRVCRALLTGAPMPTIDRQELDRLERRNLSAHYSFRRVCADPCRRAGHVYVSPGVRPCPSG